MDTEHDPPGAGPSLPGSRTGSGRIDQLMAPSEWRMGWSPQFDGLRGAGTMAVLAVHYLSSFGDVLEGLSLSVDLFFAMSGFLITTILFSEVDKRGSISVKRFYIRRVLRLYPALLLLLAVFTLFAAVAGGIHRSEYLLESLAALLYVYNFLVAWVGVDGRALIQLWTLSIEQQFYLVWPPILVMMVMPRRGSAVRVRSIRTLLWIMGVFVVALPVLRMTLEPDLGGRTLSAFLFGLSIMRPDAVVLGCIAAMVMRAWPDRGSSRQESYMSAVGNVALAVVVMVFVSGPIIEALAEHIPVVASIKWLFVPRYISPLYNVGVLAAAIVVFDLIRNPHKRIARLLSTRPMTWLGERSYAIYIWHLLVYFILKGIFSGMLPGRTRLVDIVTLPFAYGLTILISMASLKFVEEPALRLKDRFGA